jgi:thioesterase III
MMVHTEIKIRGYHLDMFRHVNNARYLEFLEEGRWSFFDGNPGFFYRLKGVTFFAVNINVNYRRPASLGDVLDIQTRLSKIGNTSGVLRQEI